MSATDRLVVYLCAEYGVTPALPIYSGGLGILAGDHVKAAADLGLPFVAIGLYYHQGYGLQSIDTYGDQHLDFPHTDPRRVLEDTGVSVTMSLAGDDVVAKLWRKTVQGEDGSVDLLLLDTLLDENTDHWQATCRMLYGGDNNNRLRQEAVLGIGGYLTVKELYPERDLRVHLNEGHTAFFAGAMATEIGVEATRERTHFTTHTPVPAGHDTFQRWDVDRTIGAYVDAEIINFGGSDSISMSHLAAGLSRSLNGVSHINARIASQDIYNGRQVDGLTNGVHLGSWTAPSMAAMFDEHLPGWRANPDLLERVDTVPDQALDHARRTAKTALLDYVNGATEMGFSADVLTVGFGRRTVPYKRATLIFSDIERLLALGSGKLQLIFAGKAHPNDLRGQKIVRELVGWSSKLQNELRVAYLPNYNMWLGRMMTSGVDVWLNNPVRPMEACGTSGMKAALNGVANASILDGWWAEGCSHGKNGWAIGGNEEDRDDLRDADALYRLLEDDIMPAYEDKARMRSIQRAAIATAPAFSARRMVQDYADGYYDLT